MRFILCALTILSIYGCSPISRSRLTKTLLETEEKFKDHTGFVLYDIEKGKTVYDFNGNRYFTPASNTKIFTLYAGLSILGDSVPGLEWIHRNDSLIFWGTGDPSFLYSEVFQDSSVYKFLSEHPSELFLSTANFDAPHFGEGWAWDDYNSGYSPERSPFPMYGNLVTVAADRDLLRVTPEYFRQFFVNGHPGNRAEVIRQQHSNDFIFHPASKPSSLREIKIPYRVDTLTLYAVLADTVKRYIRPVSIAVPPNTNTIFSVHVDSLYSVMMQDSDNFIAEQLLLMCANAISDTMKTEIAINYMKKHHLHDLPDEPVWVDGSGLSRYNLFTPRSIVALWHKIYSKVPQERLFPLLATGGVNGTIRRWYAADKPYVFGKTGTLSNNHSLSGFLVTRKGKVLIFSFMNSNFTESTNAIRTNMQNVLRDIYEHY